MKTRIIEEKTKDSTVGLFKALKEQKEVGSIEFGKKESVFASCYIFGLNVLNGHTLSGIGSELLIKAMEEMFKSGCSKVEVQPDYDDRNFYARRGFRMLENYGEHLRYYWEKGITSPVMYTRVMPPKELRHTDSSLNMSTIFYYDKSERFESCHIAGMVSDFGKLSQIGSDELIVDALKHQFASGCNKVKSFSPEIVESVSTKGIWKKSNKYNDQFYVTKEDFENLEKPKSPGL